MIQVIKLGGAILEDDRLRKDVLEQFAQLSGPKILVHGGGREADRLSTDLNIPIEKHEGRRVTNAETLRLVTMTYGGWLNKRVVAELQALGVNAIGVSGADGNLVRAVKRPTTPVDFGFVGDVSPEGVAVGNLTALLQAGFHPVFCALTHDGQGQLLNTNADTLAAVIAQALAPTQATSLALCFEHKGVLTEPKNAASWLRQLTVEEFAAMRQSGQVSAGMIPKLEAGFEAKTAGAKHVWVKAAAQLAEATGTELLAE